MMAMKRNILLLICIPLLLGACRHQVTSPQLVDAYPPVYPDYIGVTVPSTIAPMNFSTAGKEDFPINVVVKGEKEGLIEVQGKVADFPMRKWRSMLEKNIGDSIHFTVSIKEGNRWRQYRDFAMYVSPDPVPYGLVYRQIPPSYTVYSRMGIYERDLSTYKERKLVENTLVPSMCVNCHSFNQNSPDRLSLHIRGKHGATLMSIDGNQELLNTRTDSTLASCVYPYWHPSGEYIAYSTNDTHQVFHAGKGKRIDVHDNASDVLVYHPATHELLRSPLLESDSSFETYPVFSPDGRTLYFCTSRFQQMPVDYDKTHYDLCSIAFNPEDGTFGDKVDTLLQVSSNGKSISFPRPSYDGRYLMYTLSDYGTFSIWHKEADLWMLDLQTGENRPLTEINSNDTESFHNWSADSRWVVFSSRRGDGLYTRLYLTHMDEQGVFSKPFLLPQEDPWSYYDELIYSYNVPDFTDSPIDLDTKNLGEAILSDERVQIKVRN